MNTKTIIITPSAQRVIEALQHNCGTYRYYANTISRLSSLVLNFNDEIGLSDTDAISLLRSLQSLREDLAAIAGQETDQQPATDNEDVRHRVEKAFSCIQSVTDGIGNSPIYDDDDVENSRHDIDTRDI